MLEALLAALGASDAEGVNAIAERLHGAEVEVAEWRGSLSVRLTRPLRAVIDTGRRLKRRLSRSP